MQGPNLARSRCSREGDQMLRDLNVVGGGHRQMTSARPSILTGKQVAIDTTAALTGQGVARDRKQGQAIHQAEQDKRRRFPEWLTGTRFHFLVMAFEVAGRWSPSAVAFLQVQVSLRAQGGSFAVQPNSCSSRVGQHCWLVPSSERTLPWEASCACERAGGATWAIWTAFSAREGVTPCFC